MSVVFCSHIKYIGMMRICLGRFKFNFSTIGPILYCSVGFAKEWVVWANQLQWPRPTDPGKLKF